MKISRVLTSILLLLLGGCFGQKPTPVKKRATESSIQKQQKARCKQVSFHKNFFVQNNLLSLFECLGWKKEYPNITNFIANFEQSKFDHFTRKFNAKYFENRRSEKEYFKNLRVLNNEKFWENTKKMMDLSLTQDKMDFLSEMIDHSTDKASFVRLGLVKNIELFYKIKSSVGNTQSLKKFGDVFLESESEDIVRNLLAEATKNLSQPEARRKILRFLQDGEWPESYFKSVTSKDILNLHGITRGEYDRIAGEILTISDFATSKNYCVAGDAFVLVDHKSELYELGLKFMTTSSDNLMYDVSELVEKFGLFKNICNRTSSHKYYIEAAENILKKVIEVILLPGGLEFFKKILELHLTNDSHSILSFLNLLYSDFIRNYDSLYKKIQTTDNLDLYVDLVKIASKLKTLDFKNNREAIESLGLLLEQDPVFNEYFQKNAKDIVYTFLPDLMFNDLDFSAFLKSFFALMDFEPESREEYEFMGEFFVNLIKSLQDSNFRDEFKSFVSRKSLFKLMNILGQSTGTSEVAAETEPVKPITLATEGFSSECVERLKNLDKFEFEELVQGKIFECSSANENYFFYNIYSWTAEIDRLFLERFDHKFSINYGIVSPKMMGFYLNLILTINEYLYRPDSNYIREAIDNIIDVMAEENFFKIASSTIETYDHANKKLKLNQALLDTVSNFLEKKKVDNSKIRKLLETLVRPSSPEPVKRKEICKLLNKNTAKDACLDKEKFIDTVLRASKLILSKGTHGRSILSNLMDMIYTDHFKIPLFSDSSEPYRLTLSEVLDFVNVASDKTTKKKVYYHTSKSVEELDLNLSERLEVLIRDISFNDNFYGIHFMNVASKAHHYRSEMLKMRKLLKMMAGSSGIFRTFRLIGKESKWKFKNVWNSYQALLDVEGPFEIEAVKDRSYSSFIQALLGLTVHASESYEANFHPYRKPNVAFSKNHKGHLITLLADTSVISRLGHLVERQMSFPSASRKARVDKFWNKFVKRVDRLSLEKIVSKLLQHKDLKVILGDLYDLLEKTTADEAYYITEVMCLFIEDYLFNSKNPNKVFKVLDIFLDNYIDIKNNFKKLLDLESVLNIKKIRDILSEKWTRDFIIDFIDRVIIKDKAIESLVKDKKFAEEVSNNVYFIFTTELKFDTETLENIVLHKRNDWMTLLVTLDEINKSELGVKYLDNIFKILIEKENGVTKFEEALRTVFEKPDSVEIFLRDVFHKVRYFN